MLAAATRNELDAIVAWHSDRLHRSPVELEEFIAVCEQHDLQVVTVQSGAIDLTTPSGRMVARMLGSAARYESEHKSERNRRKHRELAQAGKLSGGGTRPYGFESDRRTIREDEAVIIRQLAERFIAGEALMSLLSWLNHQGIPTVTGGQWSLQVLRTMLKSGRISGQRDHHQQTLGPAEWDPIINPQQTALIQQILNDPKRKLTRSARRYLLKGMLECHACGNRMLSIPRGDGQRRYNCIKGTGFIGCGQTVTMAQPVEDLISRAVLLRMDSPAIDAALRATPPSDQNHWQHQADAAEVELKELADLRGQRVITTPEWLTAREPILARLEAAHRQMTADVGAPNARDLRGRGDALGREWRNLPLGQQRAIIQVFLDHAIVGPALRGRNFFDPNRIQPVWRI